MVIGIEATHANKPERTGVEGYCFYLIQALKKTIPATEKVILYSNRPLSGELGELPPNWEVKILRWPFKKLWNQIRLSVHFLFNKNPDVFFSPGQILPFVCPPDTVAMIHDSAFAVLPGAYGRLSRIYLNWMNRQIIARSRLIITSTEFNRRELGKLYGAEVSAKTAVIPIAFQPLTAPENFSASKLGISKKYLLSIGRLETKKNTQRIIEAFSIVKQKADLQLVLVGRPGRGFEEVEQAIAHSPVRADIIRIDRLSSADLGGLLKNAEVFVFPSLYEGFGLPVLEAFSLGVPVVASDLPALREVGGEATLFVDPLDNTAIATAVLAVLNDPVLRAKYASLGRARAESFSWEKTARETWEAIANRR